MSTVNWSLQHFTDTAANFTANNPTLLAGQIGIETDGLATNPKFKIGDGLNNWNSLPYFYGGALSAQDLNNVLSVGNTTGAYNIGVNTDQYIYFGNATRRIWHDSGAGAMLVIENTTSGDHILLKDSGQIHIDSTDINFPSLTASTVPYIDATNKFTSSAVTPTELALLSGLTGFTGSGTVLAKETSPTFTTDITTPKIIGTSLQKSLTLTTASTASSSLGVGVQFDSTLNASANNDVTYGLYITPTFNNGAYTGITNYAAGFGYGIFITSSKNTSSGLYGINILDSATASANVGGGIRFSGSYTGTTPTLAAAIDAVKDNSTGGDYGFGLRFQTRRNGDGNTTGTMKLTGAGQTTHTPLALTSGSITDWTLSIPSHTGQTASTNIPNFKVTGASKQWATGALTNQYWNYFSANTAAFVGASTITNSYGLYVEAATAGANATITNNYAAGFGGSVQITGTDLQVGTGTMIGSLRGIEVSYTSNNSNFYMRNNLTSSKSLFLIGDSTYAKSVRFQYVGSTYATSGIEQADSSNLFSVGNKLNIGTYNSHDLTFWANNTQRGSLTVNGSWNLQNGALATNATNGFVYLPSCAGTPTGVPTAITGGIPFIVDSTNNKAYIYSGGAWVALN